MFGRQTGPTDDVQMLRRRVENLEHLQDELRESFFVTSHTPPLKPQEGTIRRADGVDWNPGSGAGFYEYVNGGWAKL